MELQNIHPWKLSPKQAISLQKELAPRVLTKNELPGKVRILAGCDISLDSRSGMGFAGVVLLDAYTLETLDEFTLAGPLPFPYIPGLLTFREGPLLCRLFKKVQPTPDLVFFDGQGLAHPRRLGLASHMGLFLNTPAIGCGKSRLLGEYTEPGNKKGDCSSLLDDKGKVIGSVVRTREACKPMFISIGHRINLKTAVQWTLKATGRYRIPEPTRRAHLLVNVFRKKQIKELPSGL